VAAGDKITVTQYNASKSQAQAALTKVGRSWVWQPVPTIGSLTTFAAFDDIRGAINHAFDGVDPGSPYTLCSSQRTNDAAEYSHRTDNTGVRGYCYWCSANNGLN